MTIETTYSQARDQLKALMDDREIVVVRRRSGGAVAIIAADELESLTETAQLLRSPRNAERVLSALARARGGEVQPTPVHTLKQELGLDD